MGSDVPQIPGYRALRVGADWARAVRGSTVYFNYTDGEIAITDPGGGVPVATALSARGRPAIEGATIYAEGYGSIALDTTRCSALFWSESAVEKFLYPYYASAGGPHAYQVIHALNRAWYNYEDSRPVCALGFAYSSEAYVGQKQLFDTIHVFYVQDGQLQKSPLSEYLAPLPQTLTTQIPAVTPAPLLETVSTNGNVATPNNSVEAREVAEYVSGLRSFNVAVYGGPRGFDPQVTGCEDRGKAQHKAPLLFDAFSPVVRTGRPQITVTMNVDGVPRTLNALGGNPANIPDCAFWTDGSVDLLMVPYYASVQGPDAPWYLMVLLGKWAGWIPTSVVGAVELLLQLPGAVARLLGRLVEKTHLGGIVAHLLGEPAEPLDGLVDSRAFTIVHLPRSEYVDEDGNLIEGFRLENRTWFVTPEGAAPLVSHERRLIPHRPLTE